MKLVLKFVKSNAVLLIAAAAFGISCIFARPNVSVFGNIDYKTISTLFCMLACIAALRNIWFFRILARKIAVGFKNTRSILQVVIFVTFVFSMLIANDMALITFLPLSTVILIGSDKKKYLAFAYVMQNIAANLGGMLTPFGNPQNLYLYAYFGIPNGQFFGIMAIPFAASAVFLYLSTLLIKKEPIVFDNDLDKKLDGKRTAVYFALFLLTVVSVFRLVPFYVPLIATPLVLLFLDRKALVGVDYGLLLTFVMFFLFAGNFSRIPAVDEFFRMLLGKSVYFTGLLTCQITSNVPAAILLSQFTNAYAPLLLAVNVGGLGTVIASLASLITLKEYGKSGLSTGKYLLKFTAFNLLFLALLTGVCLAFGMI